MRVSQYTIIRLVLVVYTHFTTTNRSNDVNHLDYINCSRINQFFNEEEVLIKVRNECSDAAYKQKMAKINFHQVAGR